MGGDSADSKSAGAVFLSYASEDAAAAERIATALRAAGVEVWFDKSALRGGDAWDRSIRQQIHDCALFVPIISQHAHERLEGYFRREWKLAVDRTHDMAEIRAFLVPVVIDSTTERDPTVPEKFRELQWTRLPAGETPPTFIERIQRLLSDEVTPVQERAHSPGSFAVSRALPTSPLIRQRTGVFYGAIAAVLLLALGYFGLERLNRSKLSPPAVASIAVLPLANESGDASQQYFTDGISEDLITALSQFPGLKVIGRTSAFQFRDSKEDSRSIGAKLAVAHLLEGSVRKSGDMIRVSAELIDTADGATQWSEHYDRPYKDLFALQDEITRAVAGALRAKLVHGENISVQGDRPPSGNLDAYSAYLQGNFFKDRGNEADIRKAIDAYNAATRLDPSYARAWSALSIAWTDIGSAYAIGTAAQEAYANARAAVDTALRLAPDLAAAHVARGDLFAVVELDQRAAEAEYRRALQLAPNDGRAKYFLGSEMAILGQLEPAVDLTRQALATDPLDADWYKWLSFYLMGLNRLEEARQAIQKAIELQPTADAYHWVLTLIETRRGDAMAALAAARQERSETAREVATAIALQIGNDRARADDALRRLIQHQSETSAYSIAQIYALRNDADKTFEWLDRAWKNREASISVFLLYDPFILRWTDDPRFAAFCRKV